MFRGNFLYSSLCPLPLVMPVGATGKSSSRICLKDSQEIRPWRKEEPKKAGWYSGITSSKLKTRSIPMNRAKVPGGTFETATVVQVQLTTPSLHHSVKTAASIGCSLWVVLEGETLTQTSPEHQLKKHLTSPNNGQWPGRLQAPWVNDRWPSSAEASRASSGPHPCGFPYLSWHGSNSGHPYVSQCSYVFCNDPEPWWKHNSEAAVQTAAYAACLCQLCSQHNHFEIEKFPFRYGKINK